MINKTFLLLAGVSLSSQQAHSREQCIPADKQIDTNRSCIILQESLDRVEKDQRRQREETGGGEGGGEVLQHVMRRRIVFEGAGSSELTSQLNLIKVLLLEWRDEGMGGSYTS